MDKNNESFFKGLAVAYAENETLALENEFTELILNDRLPRSQGLDRKIKNKLFNQKARRFGMRAMPFAASLIVVLLVFNGYRSGLQRAPYETDSIASAPSTSEPSTPANSASADSVQADSTSADSVQADSAPVPMPPTEQPVTGPDLSERLQNSITFVSASLPAGYELTGVDYDNMAAIMEITSKKNNHIVLMTEEYNDFDKEGFTELRLEGSYAYGLVKDGYSLLKYEKDDMLFTLTSLYGYEDLIEISKNIL